MAGSVADFCRVGGGGVDGGAGEDDGGEVGFEGEDAAEFLHDQHDFDGAAAEAAVLFGEGQAEQAEFGVAGPHGFAPAAFGGEVGFAGSKV